MRVLVTDGQNRAALAVTRSLGRLGHEVIVAEKYARSLSQQSRHCADSIVYPDPVTASDEFIDFIAREVHLRDVDVIIPVADITTMLITGHRHRFEERCAVPFADSTVLARAADKVGIVQTAVRLDVPVPRFVVVCDPDHAAGTDIPFPVVIKPTRSRTRTPSGWKSSSVSYAANHDELRRDLSTRPRYEFPLMLQERIIGPGTGVFAYYHRGQPVTMFGHRRLRERPPWGGVSVLSESVAVSEEARLYATRLLDDLKWHGVAMVEFKTGVRDNVPRLMEINGRFWGSLQLAIDAGVDFPALLVAGAHTEAPQPPPPYRLGVRSRWLWGDVDALLLTLFGHRRAPGPQTGRAGAVLEFLKFWGRDVHYDTLQRGDLRPWLFETLSWVKVGLTQKEPKTSIDEQGFQGSDRRLHSSRTIRTSIVDDITSRTFDNRAFSEDVWNDLIARGDTRSIFLTHQWAKSWWDAYGDRYQPLLITASEASGITGIAPFVVEHGMLRERVVRFLGHGRADYADILAARGDARVGTAMLQTLLDSNRWDIIELDNIPGHSSTIDIVRRLCQRSGYRLLVEDRATCPALLVHGHEDSARSIQNKASLRRRKNYFARTGRLTCHDLTTEADIEPLLDQFFNQHVARWTGTRSPSLFLESGNRRFYRELTRSLDASRWLLFSVVAFNDHPVAFHFGFDFMGVVTWYKPSFDPAWASKSPGLVLVQHLLDYTISQGRRELDFTLGDEAFKARFTNTFRKTVRVLIFRDPVRFAIERVRRRVAGAAKLVPRA